MYVGTVIAWIVMELLSNPFINYNLILSFLYSPFALSKRWISAALAVTRR